MFLGDNIDAVETASTSKCFFENPKNDSLRFFLWQELTLKHPERMHSPMQQVAFYGDWEVSTTSRKSLSCYESPACRRVGSKKIVQNLKELLIDFVRFLE